MLVNDAGAASMKPVVSIGDAELDAMIYVNIRALTRLTLAMLPGFKERDHGTIINIASSLSVYTPPHTAIYSATKAYVMRFMGVRRELVGPALFGRRFVAAAAAGMWKSGVSLASLNQSSVMTAKKCVDVRLFLASTGKSATLLSSRKLPNCS